MFWYNSPWYSIANTSSSCNTRLPLEEQKDDERFYWVEKQMKYVWMFVTCLIAAYPAIDPDGRLPLIGSLSDRCRKVVAWTIAFGLAVLQICYQIQDDHGVELRELGLKSQNEVLQKKVEGIEIRLVGATSQVERLLRDIDVANRNLMSQQRSIGSLVFSLETSFEGRKRFADCFDALSLLDERDDYKPLICDDGVALFIFAKKDDRLAAFHFYPNSEINEVLSGMPIGTDLKIKNGKYVIAKDSDLALALERAMERKTPNFGEDSASRRLALKQLANQMGEFFRYVFRAEDYQCKDFYSAGAPNHEKRLGGLRISFHYLVSPAKKNPVRRPVELWVDNGVLAGLCGLTKRAFSSKLIDYCHTQGLEPKITVDDIEILESGGLDHEQDCAFPYSPDKVRRSAR